MRDTDLLLVQIDHLALDASASRSTVATQFEGIRLPQGDRFVDVSNCFLPNGFLWMQAGLELIHMAWNHIAELKPV